MAKRFVVIGLGNFGSTIAEALHAQGHEVIAVDTSEDAIDNIARHVTRAAAGDGRHLPTLERIGARGADVGIVSTGDDITASILASLSLKDLEVKEIYVKVISKDHARIMDRIGVTATTFPERESALALGKRLSRGHLLNFFQIARNFGLQEMAVGEKWDGKTLRQLRLRQQFRINVVAVRDVLSDEIITSPDPDRVLKDSDTLVVAGSDEDLAKAASAL